MSVRMDKVNSLIKKEVSLVLGRIQDKYLGFLTVIEVSTSKDLSSATVWLSSMEGKSETEITQVLKHYNRDIYSHIKKRVPIKRIPHLNFKIDNSASVSDKLEKL